MSEKKYFKTSQEIYKLFKSNPTMSFLLDEFNIDNDFDPEVNPNQTLKLREVCDFLELNSEEILNTKLSMYYNDSSILEQLAELYGFDPMTYPKPYDQYISSSGSKLSELLNYTLYIYKFGSIDNFYEKHILDFFPEYDREQIKDNEKLDLTITSLGRKLDEMEYGLTKLKNIYDIDQTPDDLLDYLGQNLGYEKEDFTLNNVSFRELLKNIIDIYKVKGTNYSFSFFFKFLGFNINLKEFYFNRDVKNPEGFPGVDENNVEYYLTTENPIFDTSQNKPAPNLEPIRDLNDWDLEVESIKNSGSINTTQYMLGYETFNNNALTWHSNPWTYFKTNLIEYQLNPFFDKLNLTASDNETIRKYVRFLSPTYLFTWINVNLRPWIEDMTLILENAEQWRIEINKTLGDPRPTPDPWPGLPQGVGGVPSNTTGIFHKKTATDPGFEPPYLDYEDVSDYIQLYEYNPITKKLTSHGDEVNVSIVNNMNLKGIETIGTILRRDGTHIRKPGNPKHITGATHKGEKRVAFDLTDVYVKNYGDMDWIDYSFNPYPAIPDDHSPKQNRVYDSSIVEFSWEDVDGAEGYWLQLSDSFLFDGTYIDEKNILNNEFINPLPLHNNQYFWRVKVKNNASYEETHPERWSPWSSTWVFTLKDLPFPADGEIINKDTVYVKSNYIYNLDFTQRVFQNLPLTIEWEKNDDAEEWDFQLALDVSFAVKQSNITGLKKNETSVTLENDTYYWRVRYKDKNTGNYSSWASHEFIVDFPAIINI